MSTDTLLRTMPGTTYRTGLTWKPYTYRGTGTDTLTAWMDELDEALAPDSDALVWPHGTLTGYRRHRGKRETPCEPCLDAYRESTRKPCGTSAAYRRHLRNGEQVDAACQAAEARRSADAEARRQRDRRAS